MPFLLSSITKKKFRGQPKHVGEERYLEDHQKLIFLSFDSSTNSERAGNIFC